MFLSASTAGAEERWNPQVATAAQRSTALVRGAGGQTASAFVVDSHGLLLTTARVLPWEEPGHEVEVWLHAGEADQKEYLARTIKTDPRLDLGLLLIEGDPHLDALKLADDASIVGQQPVQVISFPLLQFATGVPPEAATPVRLQSPAAAVGRVSKINLSGKSVDWLDLDAKLEVGAAGGPVINQRGEALAIISTPTEQFRDPRAVSAGRIRDFLQNPAALLLPSAVDYDHRNDPVEFDAIYICAEGTAAPLSGELSLDDGAGKIRHVPLEAKSAPGSPVVRFAAKAPLVVAGARPVHVTATIDGKSVTGDSHDRAISVGDASVLLSSVKAIFPGQVQLVDGRVLWEKPAKLGSIRDAAGAMHELVGFTRIDVQTEIAVVCHASIKRGSVTTDAQQTVRVDPSPWRAEPLPPAPVEESDRSLLDGKGHGMDRKLWQVDIESKEPPRVVWSTDGAQMFILSRDRQSSSSLPPLGILRQVATDKLTELRRIPLEGSELALTPKYVLVLFRDTIWMVDRQTLQLQRRIAIDSADALACTPDGTLAFTIAYEKAALQVIDLKTGKVVHSYSGTELGASPGVLRRSSSTPGPLKLSQYLAIAPDGSSLFTLSDSSIVRLQLHKSEVSLAEVGPALRGMFAHELIMSPDGKYIARKGGHEPKEAAGAGDGLADRDTNTSVYRCGDLQHAITTIPGVNNRAANVGFDAANHVYFHFTGQQEDIDRADLSTLPPKTEHFKELGDGLFLVWPSGGKLFRYPQVGRLMLLDLPEMTAADEAVAAAVHPVAKAKSTGIAINADTVLPTLLWSDDGKLVYAMETTGRLHAIRVPELTESRTLEVGPGCYGFEASAAGLLALLPDDRQLVVIDPKTFKEKTRITYDTGKGKLGKGARLNHVKLGVAVREHHPLVSSAKSNLAIVQEDLVHWALIDVQTGKQLNPPGPYPMKVRDAASGNLVDVKYHLIDTILMSPDGKHVIASNPKTGAWRFKLDGDHLLCEETGGLDARVAPAIVAFSPDGRFMIGEPRVMTREAPHPLHGFVGYALTDVFRYADFGKSAAPVVTFETEQPPMREAISLYGAAPICAVLGRASILTRFDTRGVEHDEFSTDPNWNPSPLTRTANGRALLAHPDGRGWLALSNLGLYWVELPTLSDRKPPVNSAVPLAHPANQ